jgi:hypothetical protein
MKYQATATATEAWADSPVLPDLHRRRYILLTKVALNNNELTLKKNNERNNNIFIHLWTNICPNCLFELFSLSVNVGRVKLPFVGEPSLGASLLLLYGNAAFYLKLQMLCPVITLYQAMQGETGRIIRN